ncbi:MAG: glycosyltransferase [Thermoplasmata archaeon]
MARTSPLSVQATRPAGRFSSGDAAAFEDSLDLDTMPYMEPWIGSEPEMLGPTPQESPWPSVRSSTSVARVLVTIPVRNESERLIPAIRALKEVFDASGFAYQIAVAEDGSTDGTKALLHRLPELFPEILIQEWPHALGRGKALRQLWRAQIADIYCFTDADLASGTKPLATVVREVANGWDVVTGSRYSVGSKVHRPPLRFLVSRAYNWLVRFAFSDGLRDHQCGLKAFSASAVELLLDQTTEDSWFWDTEILILAHAGGLRIKEVPVEWAEMKTSRTRFGRLFGDIMLHGGGLIRLKSRIRSRQIRARPRSFDAVISRAEPQRSRRPTPNIQLSQRP